MPPQQASTKSVAPFTIAKAPVTFFPEVSNSPTVNVAGTSEDETAADGLSPHQPLEFAAMENVPSEYASETTAQECTQIVSLQQFVANRTDFIIRYLNLNFVQDYEQLDHEQGIFDYISKRKNHVAAFNKNLRFVGLHYRRAQEEITSYVEKYYSKCLHATESYRQLVTLSKYFINLYLNYLGAPKKF